MDNIFFKSIAWRCRRGMLELDILLQRFWQSQANILSLNLVNDFKDLLESTDPDLNLWLTGKTNPPLKFEKIVHVIRKSHEI